MAEQSDFSQHMTPDGIDVFGAMGIMEGQDDSSKTPDGQDAGPGDGKAAPSQDKQAAVETGQAAASGDGQGDEGEPTPQDFGYTSWEEAAKAILGQEDVAAQIDGNLKKQYDSIRPEYTRVTQELAELKRQNEMLLAAIQGTQQNPPGRPAQNLPPQITKEEIDELWLTDPQQAMMLTLRSNPDLIREMVGEIPELEEVRELRGYREAERVVGALKEKYHDFAQYEPKVMDEITALGDEMAPYVANPVAVEYVLRAVRAENMLRGLFEKVGRAHLASIATAKDNKGAVNLGGGGLNPTKINGLDGKVDVGSIKGLPVEDLDFVIPGRSARYQG